MPTLDGRFSTTCTRARSPAMCSSSRGRGTKASTAAAAAIQYNAGDGGGAEEPYEAAEGLLAEFEQNADEKNYQKRRAFRQAEGPV